MTETVKQQGHEDNDINVRAIIGFAIGLVVVAVVINGLVWLLFAYFSGREASQNARQYPLAVAEGSRLPPEPRLQTNPRQDLRDLRAQEDDLLNGYRWVDKTAGIVRIPIGEAMRLTVERGLPARTEGK